MKSFKIIFISTILIMIVLLTSSCSLFMTVREDDFVFQKMNINDNMAYAVVKYKGKEKDITIPIYVNGREVQSIMNDAFKESDITKVTIPDTVKTILMGAFKDCKDLKEVVMPKGVWSIFNECFKGCTSLEQITIEGGIVRDKILGGSIGESSFENCTSLKQITITDSRLITVNAFKGCASLETLTLTNIQSLDRNALAGTSLKRLYIDKNTLYIYMDAFSGCTDLEVYLEVTEKPEKWHEGWDNDLKAVHWGITREDFDKLG